MFMSAFLYQLSTEDEGSIQGNTELRFEGEKNQFFNTWSHESLLDKFLFSRI